MNNIDFKFLNLLLKFTQKELYSFMINFLSSYYNNKIIAIKDKFIAALGKEPIGLVAHMDTVLNQPPTKIYHDKNKHIIWGKNGLGADDRAGVYAIVKLVEKGYKPSIFLTCDEETSAAGAYELATYQTPDNLHFLIEIDRRGTKDSVYYNCENEKFTNYINSFGFETAIGLFSDISIIAEAWKIAAVNISTGYFYEHTPKEFLHYPTLNETIRKVELILQSPSIPFSFIKKEKGPCIFCQTETRYKYQDCFICEECVKKYKLDGDNIKNA